MKNLIVVLFIALIIVSCESKAPTEAFNDDINATVLDKVTLNWTELYNNYATYSPLWAGQSTDWLPYTYGAGVASYKLKFEFNRDLVVGIGGGGSTEDEVTVIVKNQNNVVVLNKVYHLVELTEWYTFIETLNNPKGINSTYQIMITASPDFYEALWAKVYTAPYTYRTVPALPD